MSADSQRKKDLADVIESAIRRELRASGLPSKERAEVSRTDKLNLQVKVWGPIGIHYYNVKISEAM